MSKYVKIFPINLISPSIFSRNIHTGTEVFRQFLDNVPDMLIINGGSFIHIFQSDIALLISFVYKNIKWGLTILATNFVSLFIRSFIFIIGQFLVPDTLSSFPWIAVEKKNICTLWHKIKVSTLETVISNPAKSQVTPFWLNIKISATKFPAETGFLKFFERTLKEKNSCSFISNYPYFIFFLFTKIVNLWCCFFEH